ncbi:hypothetical protein EDD22DRAFT_903048 [Suillus occidentalis]|nr:hypothetical protein EDD22DRAFT_903048 [Suillus occidentalis]
MGQLWYGPIYTTHRPPPWLVACQVTDFLILNVIKRNLSCSADRCPISLVHAMSDSNTISGLVPVPHCSVAQDPGLLSPIQRLPSNTRVVVYFSHDIYQLLEVILGGPPNMINASSSSVEVQVNDGTTGVRYRGQISDIQPAPDGMRSSWEHTTATLGTGSFESAPRDLDNHAALQVRVHHPSLPLELASTIQPVFLPSVSSSSNTVAPPSNKLHSFGGGATTPEQQIQYPGSCGFESALGDLKDYASLGVHHPSLPQELPSTMQPVFIPSVSSSTTATSLSAQPSFLDDSATLPEIRSADRQVSYHSGYGIQATHGNQIQEFGCPRACVVDGLLVDEQDLRNQNTNNGSINVHVCNREDSPCGLWVKTDRRSIICHGQRWHGDARGGEDRKITCPWSGCDSQMRASAIPRHTLSAHFGAVWICRGTGCSKVFTRYYSFKAHSRKYGCHEATLRYDTSTRVINTTSL